MRPMSLLTGLILAAPALFAQGAAPVAAPQTRVPTAADSAVMRALELPQIFQRARDAGIPDSSLRGMIDAMRRRGIPTEEAIPAVEMEVEAVEAGGPKDNFGSFVRAQVESGLRGQELAAAIRAEREARGMGPGRRDRGGRPEGAGARSEKGGRPPGAGARPPRAGRPDTTAERSKGPATPTSRRP